MNAPIIQSPTLFGTDGVRGTPGTSPLDEQTLARLGAAIASSIMQLSRAPRVLIGRDTRESGPWITKQLLRGLTSGGAEVTDGDVMSTPAIAFLTKEGGFDAGIVVSASHNPFQDNGIKVFTRDGRKADRELEVRLTELIADDTRTLPASEPSTLEPRGLLEPYLAHTCQILEGVCLPAGFSLAIDCANGANSGIAPAALRRLGLDLHVIHDSPDGRNINLHCGSTHPEALAQVVVGERCNLGAAFDGDGDRVVFIDHEGAVVDGDAVLLIAARWLAGSGRLAHDAVVATVMSNIGLERALRADGISLYRCPVGDRCVAAEMEKRGLVLGGEQSGHIIVVDHLSTGDGLATAMLIVRALVESGRSLRDLAADLLPSPQVLLNVPVSRRTPLGDLPAVRALVDAAEQRLADEGRVLVRYSGTEPLLRIMLEGPDSVVIQQMADGIAAQVRADLGEPGG